MSTKRKRSANADRVRLWREANPKKHAAYQREYRKRRSDLIAAYDDVIAKQDEEIASLKAKVKRLQRAVRKVER